MRIRKRAVPFPLSLLSPVPIPSSDPATLPQDRRSLSSSLSTVQLPSPLLESNGSATYRPLDSHAHLHVRTPLLESPDLLRLVIDDGTSDTQSPRRLSRGVGIATTAAEVKPPLISGSREPEVADGGEREESEKMIRSIEDDGDDERMEDTNQSTSNHHPDVNQSSLLGANSDKFPSPVSSSSLHHATQEENPFRTPTPPMRWLDGDKNMPLKKRRTTFEMMNGKDQVTPPGTRMMMSKTNKKSSFHSDSANTVVVEDHEDGDYNIDIHADADADAAAAAADNNYTSNISSHKRISRLGINIGNNKKKKGAAAKKTTSKSKGKSKRASSTSGTRILMEGSRCSRVNGRGWRCCQPTLVGYSLCEHHLGKGRLIKSISSTSTVLPSRSLSSVQSPVSPCSSTTNPPPSSPQFIKKKNVNHIQNGARADAAIHDVDPEDEAHDDVVTEHQMPILPTKHNSGISSKKRVKIGVVKARSLSSLLGQPNTMVVRHAA